MAGPLCIKCYEEGIDESTDWKTWHTYILIDKNTFMALSLVFPFSPIILILLNRKYISMNAKWERKYAFAHRLSPLEGNDSSLS